MPEGGYWKTWTNKEKEIKFGKFALENSGVFMKIVNEGKPTPQAAESCTETDFFSPGLGIVGAVSDLP